MAGWGLVSIPLDWLIKGGEDERSAKNITVEESGTAGKPNNITGLAYRNRHKHRSNVRSTVENPSGVFQFRISRLVIVHVHWLVDHL